eukprot:350093-Chlamydomonas_euryale.AAC.5
MKRSWAPGCAVDEYGCERGVAQRCGAKELRKGGGGCGKATCTDDDRCGGCGVWVGWQAEHGKRTRRNITRCYCCCVSEVYVCVARFPLLRRGTEACLCFWTQQRCHTLGSQAHNVMTQMCTNTQSVTSAAHTCVTSAAHACKTSAEHA